MISELFSWPVARHTARERGLAPVTLGIALVLVLIGMLRGSADTWGAEAFSGFGAFWFFLLTLFLGGGLLADEVESGHAQLVLLRPITRAQWVGGRLVGAALVLCLAGTAGWASSVLASFTRGGAGELPGRLLVLPLALLPALGWPSAPQPAAGRTPAFSSRSAWRGRSPPSPCRSRFPSSDCSP